MRASMTVLIASTRTLTRPHSSGFSGRDDSSFSSMENAKARPLKAVSLAAFDGFEQSLPADFGSLHLDSVKANTGRLPDRKESENNSGVTSS